MSVVCFTSLKGGVGKTSLSTNVAHALASQNFKTVLVDLDPSSHASRLLLTRAPAPVVSSKEGTSKTGISKAGASKAGAAKADVARPQNEAPLARLLLRPELQQTAPPSSLLSFAEEKNIPLLRQARPNLTVLPAGAELRHFYWGQGSKTFAKNFPRLLGELASRFDYVVVDTPPELSIPTRNALAQTDLAIVPVDSSEMSIFCLEELICATTHIKGPMWSILRSMVGRSASRVRSLAESRLNRHIEFSSPGVDADSLDMDDDRALGELDLSDPSIFISMLHSREGKSQTAVEGETDSGSSEALAGSSEESSKNPIYLLNTVVYRTETQNKLSLLCNTSFDSRQTANLAGNYLLLAREIEGLLLLNTERNSLKNDGSKNGGSKIVGDISNATRQGTSRLGNERQGNERQGNEQQQALRFTA